MNLTQSAVLTEPEVRQLLGLSKITLHRMRYRPNCGGLPYVKLSPGRIGYLRSDVETYLNECRVGARAAPRERALPVEALPVDILPVPVEGSEKLGQTF
jgi:predicted DNA-binding transcriptional regulator AlpA